MRQTWLGIVAAMFFCSFAVGEELFTTECRHSDNSFSCVKYVRNYDGDTLTVNIPRVHPILGDMITVRVSGIDAAEMSGDSACERQAAYIAQQEVQKVLSQARRIDLRGIQRDKYFRVLANVVVDGQSLGEHMLKTRMAVDYDGGHKAAVDWCRFAPQPL